MGRDLCCANLNGDIPCPDGIDVTEFSAGSEQPDSEECRGSVYRGQRKGRTVTSAFQQCIWPDCNATFDVGQILTSCPKCGSLLDVRYDWNQARVPERLSRFGDRWRKRFSTSSKPTPGKWPRALRRHPQILGSPYDARLFGDT